jgi:hypothetical protein
MIPCRRACQLLFRARTRTRSAEPFEYRYLKNRTYSIYVHTAQRTIKWFSYLILIPHQRTFCSHQIKIKKFLIYCVILIIISSKVKRDHDRRVHDRVLGGHGPLSSSSKAATTQYSITTTTTSTNTPTRSEYIRTSACSHLVMSREPSAY